ncbi:MAG: hypothetical protein ABH956_02450 [Candidatus Nealsonbacteria bacterium]
MFLLIICVLIFSLIFIIICPLLLITIRPYIRREIKDLIGIFTGKYSYRTSKKLLKDA